MTTDIDLLRGRSVVAAIDFHLTRIYPTNATRELTHECIVAPDPTGRFQHAHPGSGGADGTDEADRSEYWQEIAETLEPAREILILGNGKGKANASHLWVSYVEEHRRDVAAKLVADVRMDIDDLEGAKLLELAQDFFSSPAHARFRRSPRMTDGGSLG